MTQTDYDPNASLVEISLGDAHYREDDEIQPKVKNHEYIQSNSIKGLHRTFKLYDNLYLYCSKKAFVPKKFRSIESPEHRVDLTYLDLKPFKSRLIAWRWLLWGLILLATSVLTIYIGEFSGFSIAHPLMLPVGVLIGTFGLVFILLSYYKSYSLMVYRSYAGRVPLVVLTHKPRNKDYKAFTSLVEDKIRDAQRRNGITMRDRLVGEMKDIRRLKDAGIVNEAWYHQAQSKIFKHEAFKN